jgi:predicted deacylase
LSAQGTFRIRDIAAGKGQKTRGFLPIGETLTGPIQLPIVIISGRGDGPVLCLTAGVHATEYPSIDALMRLSRELEPQDLRGTLIAVPVVNMHMFASRSGFVSPIDGQNLNKIAPGGKSGSISDICADVLLNEVIARAEYHVDMHAGDLGEILYAFGGYPLTGDSDRDRRGEALARLYSPRLIALYREGSKLPPAPGSIVLEATRRGVVSILAESGGNGTLEEPDVQVHLAGIRNIMRYLQMIDGDPLVPAHQLVATERYVTRATRSGLLRLKVEIGEAVREGQEAAEICDVWGETIERVTFTRPGVTGLIWSHKAVNTGDPVVRCWITEPAPRFGETDRFIRAS